MIGLGADGRGGKGGGDRNREARQEGAVVSERVNAIGVDGNDLRIAAPIEVTDGRCREATMAGGDSTGGKGRRAHMVRDNGRNCAEEGCTAVEVACGGA